MSVENAELIRIATDILNPQVVEGRLFGDVGAALLTEDGHVYTGVSIDTPSWGLCAERSAIAAMITARHYRIKKVVAIWRDNRSGKLHVLPPCGVCREFMRNVDPGNLDAEIILSRLGSARLKDLLPLHEWPDSLDNE